jgi:hypothetical protein
MVRRELHNVEPYAAAAEASAATVTYGGDNPNHPSAVGRYGMPEDTLGLVMLYQVSLRDLLDLGLLLPGTPLSLAGAPGGVPVTGTLTDHGHLDVAGIVTATPEAAARTFGLPESQNAWDALAHRRPGHHPRSAAGLHSRRPREGCHLTVLGLTGMDEDRRVGG